MSLRSIAPAPVVDVKKNVVVGDRVRGGLSGTPQLKNVQGSQTSNEACATYERRSASGPLEVVEQSDADVFFGG